MASLRERLEYIVTVDSKQAVKSLEAVGKATEKELGRTESKLDQASVGLTKFGAGAVGVAGVAGVALYKLGSAASDVEESVNAVNVTFGAAADGVLELSDAAARGVGLSKAEFNGLAVSFAGFAKQLDGNVAQSIDDITTRAADFASVMNMDVNEAARIFQSALAGETEPIKKFGINMSAAAVEAYALREGLAASSAEMTEGIKVQARYGLLMESTSQMAGDFANTSDGAANSQRIMTAELKNAASEIGAGVLPVMTNLVGGLAGAASAFGDLPGPAKQAAGGILTIGTAALGVGGALSFVVGQTIKFRDTISNLSPKMTAAGAALGVVAVAAAGYAAEAQRSANNTNMLTTALASLNQVADERILDDLAASLHAAAANGDDTADMLADLGQTSQGTLERIRDLLAATDDGSISYRGFTLTVDDVNAALDEASRRQTQVAEDTARTTTATGELADEFDNAEAAATPFVSKIQALADELAAVKAAEDELRESRKTAAETARALEAATDTYQDSLVDLYVVQNDVKSSAEDVETANRNAADRAIDMAEAYAEQQIAAGNAKSANDLQVESLEYVASTLEPGSPLRVQLEQYIALLQGVPKNITTTLTVNQEGTLDFNNGGSSVRGGAFSGMVQGATSAWNAALSAWGASRPGSGPSQADKDRQKFDSEFAAAKVRYERGTYTADAYLAELRRLQAAYKWRKHSEPGMALWREIKRVNKEAKEAAAELVKDVDGPARDPWQQAAANQAAVEAAQNLSSTAASSMAALSDRDPNNDASALDAWADAIWRDIEARADRKFDVKGRRWADFARKQLESAIAANPALASRLRVYLVGIPTFGGGDGAGGPSSTTRPPKPGGTGGASRMAMAGTGGGGAGGVTVNAVFPNVYSADRKSVQRAMNELSPYIERALNKREREQG